MGNQDNLAVFTLIDQWLVNSSHSQRDKINQEITANIKGDSDYTKMVIAKFSNGYINIYLYDQYSIAHVYSPIGDRYTIDDNRIGKAVECYILNKQLGMYLYGAIRNYKES